MADQNQNPEERTVEAFDYELGQLHGLPGVTFTKQATVQATNGLTESSTWIVGGTMLTMVIAWFGIERRRFDGPPHPAVTSHRDEPNGDQMNHS